jgi:hypothetical protein
VIGFQDHGKQIGIGMSNSTGSPIKFPSAGMLLQNRRNMGPFDFSNPAKMARPT